MSFANYEVRELIKYLPEALFLEDWEGNILDVNQEACRLLGYRREELLEQDVDKIVPEDQPVFQPGQIDEATREGEPIETINLRKDGTHLPVELKGRIIDVEGEKRVLVSVRDITERKTYSKKLREVEELSREIKLTQNKEKLYDLVVEGIEDTLGYGTYSICEKRDDIIEIVRIKGDYLEESMGREMPIDGKGLIPAACRKEEPLYVEDVTDDDRYVHGTPSPGSEFVIPLQVEGKLYGALDFENENKDAFHARDRELMEVLGSQMAIALQSLERLQLYDEQRDKLRKLHETVYRLQHQDTEDGLAKTAVRAVEEMLEFELAAIALVEGDYLVPKANTSNLEPAETREFKIGEGIAGKTVQEGETIWGDDIRSFPEGEPTQESYRAFISVPIGKVGTLQIISEKVGKFDKRDVKLAEILAGHLNEEVQRIRLEQELRRQAIRDPLTGLYNRRYFNETLKKEVEKAERHSRPVAFLMIDIDNFKEVNDKYSHQTGDDVLKQVAMVLQNNVRGADTVVRYGGDEFLIMMPDTDGESNRVVSRLKDHLEEWNENNEILDYKLTLSMGSTHWSADQDRDVEEALEEADREMYEDKAE